MLGTRDQRPMQGAAQCLKRSYCLTGNRLSTTEENGGTAEEDMEIDLIEEDAFSDRLLSRTFRTALTAGDYLGNLGLKAATNPRRYPQ